MVFIRIMGITVSLGTTILELATATAESEGTAGALGAGLVVSGGAVGCG
jgi:hypothetical protein